MPSGEVSPRNPSADFRADATLPAPQDEDPPAEGCCCVCFRRQMNHQEFKGNLSFYLRPLCSIILMASCGVALIVMGGAMIFCAMLEHDFEIPYSANWYCLGAILG